MKRTDLYFALAIVAIFLPFALCTPLYEWYKEFNSAHGMVMSFLKFGLLSTMGEMLGCRISTGKYFTPTFGVLPRMVVWGFLGMGINMAMIIFSKGTPMFMQYMGDYYNVIPGWTDARAAAWAMLQKISTGTPVQEAADEFVSIANAAAAG